MFRQPLHCMHKTNKCLLFSLLMNQNGTILKYILNIVLIAADFNKTYEPYHYMTCSSTGQLQLDNITKTDFFANMITILETALLDESTQVNRNKA